MLCIRVWRDPKHIVVFYLLLGQLWHWQEVIGFDEQHSVKWHVWKWVVLADVLE